MIIEISDQAYRASIDLTGIDAPGEIAERVARAYISALITDLLTYGASQKAFSELQLATLEWAGRKQELVMQYQLGEMDSE